MSYITLNQSSSRVLERILEIRQEDLFKIFVQRKKGARELNIKDYKELNIIIDHLIITLPYILTENKEQVEAINPFKNNWNSSQMAIIHFHNELISLNFGSTNEKFIEGFNDLVKSVNNDTKKIKNIEQTIQNLVDPLINLCKSHSDDLRATKLMTMLVESKLAYKEIKHIRESEVKYLMAVDAELKANQKKLEDLIIKMKSKKNYVV